jgi:GPI mannosyltransferase 2
MQPTAQPQVYRDLGVDSSFQIYMAGYKSTIGKQIALSIERSCIQSNQFCRNVGLFRYWTLSNLPLFCIATPMLMILCQACWSGLAMTHTLQIWPARIHGDPIQKTRLRQSFLFRLVIPQALLTVAALTSYHVQIISRISSGYPLWYWYLASRALDGVEERKRRSPGARVFTASLRWIVLYGLIQAVLFGSFLPPA